MARRNKTVLTRPRPARRSTVKRVSKKRAKKPLFSAHRHTFHLLPHAHTSYPLLLFLLLLLGVLLVGWTSAAKADDFNVQAKVKGIPPASPAVITSPTEGAIFQEVPIDVAGTCPLDSYINLYRNNFFSGTVLCDAGGNFHLQSDLFIGANQLQARVFNKTDDEGPISGIVTVNYQPPNPPQPVPSGNGKSPHVVVPDQLSLSTNFVYKGYYAGQEAVWKFNLSGGVGPYAINIDWGDGSKPSLLSRKAVGEFTASHTYTHQPSYGNAYTIRVQASDSDEQTAFLQLVAIVNQAQAGAHGLPFIGGTGGNLPTIIRQFLHFVWPTYSIALLVVLSFCLGELRAYEKLRPFFMPHHNHHA